GLQATVQPGFDFPEQFVTQRRGGKKVFVMNLVDERQDLIVSMLFGGFCGEIPIAPNRCDRIAGVIDEEIRRGKLGHAPSETNDFFLDAFDIAQDTAANDVAVDSVARPLLFPVAGYSGTQPGVVGEKTRRRPGHESTSKIPSSTGTVER